MDSDSQQLEISYVATQSDEEDYAFRNSERKKKQKVKKVRKEMDRLTMSGKSNVENIMIKLRNRQTFGYFSSDSRKRFKEQPFKKVPEALNFCLKDIIPFCHLDSHIFMGLTACGQFLLSYKFTLNHEIAAYYDVFTVYRYELFLWIYRPHYPLHKYFSVNLFDDNGVDGMKKVTMTQRSCDSSVLVIHGESDTFDKNSYVTYVRVPRLGCLDCRELRKDNFDPTMPREAMLCIKCALMIHIKYRDGESAPKFRPEVNLTCPKFILMTENTFIHAVSVDLDMTRIRETNTGNTYRYTPLSMNFQKSMDIDVRSETTTNVTDNDVSGRRLTIADEIIADFEEFEIESVAGIMTPKPLHDTNENISLPMRSLSDYQTGKRALSLQKPIESAPSSSRVQEDVKPLKNITSSSKVSTKEKIKLYEFSEENENCEKISTFRKRRLADKKYEFNEDSFDSILPFNRIRERIRSRLPRPNIPQSAGIESAGSHLHRASPNQGFRSPCGSPVGYRFLRSPPGMRSPNYYTQRSPSNNIPMMHSNQNLKNLYSGLLSPRSSAPGRSSNNLQIYSLRPEDLRQAISSPIHKPYDNENNENQQSLSNLSNSKTDKDPSLANQESQEPWKKLCSKKFTRQFVEEDDANSVITTTEEDDCISPGYHTSLPLEVHGACYSKMPSISRASCTQAKNRPIVYVTQNTFDTESFTVNVAIFVCKQNNKFYDMLSDFTYSILQVCPISSTLTCCTKIEFVANDMSPESQLRVHRPNNCQKYQLRTLFTWNINDGALTILDYGKLVLLKDTLQTFAPTVDVNELTNKLEMKQNQIFSHLRIHTADIKKSKQSVIDMHNMIEISRKKDTDSSSFSDISSFNENFESSDDETSSDILL